MWILRAAWTPRWATGVHLLKVQQTRLFEKLSIAFKLYPAPVLAPISLFHTKTDQFSHLSLRHVAALKRPSSGSMPTITSQHQGQHNESPDVQRNCTSGDSFCWPWCWTLRSSGMCTQCRLVVSCRRFAATYWSHLQDWPLKMGPLFVPKLNK